MHKNNALWLLLHISGIMLGAASSSSGTPEPSYQATTKPLLKEAMIEISLAHLPEQLQSFKESISAGTFRAENILVMGPPGIGKTISVTAIAQKFYKENGHVLHGASLVGNQYQNSSVMVLQQTIAPIIKRAETVPQMIVVDEFQKLFKRTKHSSSEKTNAESEMLSLFDDMEKTGNIIFVGTCNKISNLSEPILTRFDEQFMLDKASKGLYKATLEFHLSQTGIRTTVTTSADLEEVINQFPFELRAIKSIIRSTQRMKMAKNPTNPEQITKDDLLEAIKRIASQRAPAPLTWSKWAKKNHLKITIISSVASVILISAGLYFGYKHYKESAARHAQERTEDLKRLAAERLADLARHATERAEDLRLADDRCKQSAADEFARKVIHATNPWFMSKSLYYPYETASKEVKAEILKNDAVYYAGVKARAEELSSDAASLADTVVTGYLIANPIDPTACSIL